jgi:hypothetical protein
MFKPRLSLAGVAGLGILTLAVPAWSLDLIGLTDRNELVLFSDGAPQTARTVPLSGVQGRLLGIDLRPSNKTLYGIGSDGAIYTIDPATGLALSQARISVPLEADDHAAVDFNPQADRLRVIGSKGQSLRVNVDTGQAVVDGRLAYRPSDRNAGKSPGMMAAAYINSFAGATQTQLFEFDGANGAFVVQDPPNDGILATIATITLPPGAKGIAIDIFTDHKGDYHGFAAVAGQLYRFDVGTGALTMVGPIGDGKGMIVDVAVATTR